MHKIVCSDIQRRHRAFQRKLQVIDEAWANVEAHTEKVGIGPSVFDYSILLHDQDLRWSPEEIDPILLPLQAEMDNFYKNLRAVVKEGFWMNPSPVASIPEEDETYFHEIAIALMGDFDHYDSVSPDIDKGELFRRMVFGDGPGFVSRAEWLASYSLLQAGREEATNEVRDMYRKRATVQVIEFLRDELNTAAYRDHLRATKKKQQGGSHSAASCG